MDHLKNVDAQGRGRQHKSRQSWLWGWYIYLYILTPCRAMYFILDAGTLAQEEQLKIANIAK